MLQKNSQMMPGVVIEIHVSNNILLVLTNADKLQYSVQFYGNTVS